MKNTFGSSIAVTIFGESHGSHIGAVVDGIAPGIDVNTDFIRSQLDKRRPKDRISTARREKDEFSIVSGVFNGKTTGTPICIIIPNGDTKSGDYAKTAGLARPGHADFSARCKYHGFEDYRGGGHFSGRITAAIVAAGALAITALESKDIYIGTHIKKCAKIPDRDFEDIKTDIQYLKSADFGVLSPDIEEKMRAEITAAANDGDSVGGILETAVYGLPSGVGEPWFDTFEGILSHALFSIPALKGVQFGKGFDMADMTGSTANDPLRVKDGTIYTETNNNGGINGGITNGMPVVFSCVIKPTSSIYKEQRTIDMNTGENALIKVHGRHDPAIIHRARIVVDSITALTVCDILAQRFGTDYFRGDSI